MYGQLDTAERPKWRYWTSSLMLITPSLAAVPSVWCFSLTSLILIKGQFDADKKTVLCWWTDSAVMYGQFDASEHEFQCQWTANLRHLSSLSEESILLYVLIPLWIKRFSSTRYAVSVNAGNVQRIRILGYSSGWMFSSLLQKV
jgi:hypothetical protein